MDSDALQPLALAVGEALLHSKQVLTLAESCTGGLVSALVTEISGSSQWFDSGMVTYSNQAKQDLLGVQETSLVKFGAVSEEVAAEMALGAIKQGRANVAASITGIAGPTGGTPEKPVGTVCFAWVRDQSKLITKTCHFSGNRQQVREQAAHECLLGVLDTLNRT